MTFPLFLLMIRPTILPALSMLCLSLVAGARTLFALEFLQISGAGSRAGISPLHYLSIQGPVIVRYLRLLLLPYGFTCDPEIPIRTDWHAWLAWFALVAIAALLWKFHPHGKWFAAGLILLAPSSSIFPAEDLAADRRLIADVRFLVFHRIAVAAREPTGDADTCGGRIGCPIRGSNPSLEVGTDAMGGGR